MAEDLKRMYRTVMDDHFPSQMTISFGDQSLVYRVLVELGHLLVYGTGKVR